MALPPSFLIVMLISMQLLSVFALSKSFLRNRVAFMATQSHNHNTSQAPEGVVEPYSKKMLEVWKTKDEFEFHCDQAQEKDAEIIEDLEKESRALGGDVAGNMAKVSSIDSTEKRLRQDEALQEGRIHTAKRICDKEKKHMEHTKETVTNAQKRQKNG